jgi:hypothetical protein
MSSNDALIALACITVAIVVGVQLWRSARRGALRCVRRQAGYASRPQHLTAEGQEPYGAMTPERARAIRHEAELSARRAAGGQLAEPVNPYARGTQEFVLWLVTYHLTMTEIDEEAAAARAVSSHA